MQNREFEKQVQDKMEELKLTPADAVWEKVEASLPEEKKRRWIIFILLFAIVATGSVLLWNAMNTTEMKKETATVKENDLKNATAHYIDTMQRVNDDGAVAIRKETGDKNDTGAIITTTANKKNTTNALLKIKIKNAAIDSLADVPGDDKVIKKQQQFNSTAVVKIKVKAPVSSEGVEEKNDEVINKTNIETKINNDKDTITTSLTDSLVATNKKPQIDSVPALKKDTLTAVVKKETQQKNKTKWSYGVESGGGFSTIKSGLFSSTTIYADAQFNSSISSSPGSGTTIVNGPSKPRRGGTFDLGFYAEKPINKKWSFKTGLHYLYQSNNIKVGEKVDSAATFSFDMNKSIVAASYYRGNNTNNYTNQFHLLEIPLLFQYKLSSSLPISLDAGPSVAYLLQSNALIYNKRALAYFTDKSIFNKLLLSVNAGAAINLAKKSKLPVTIGYRFKYGVGSIVKTSLGEQHFITSMLYLKIPLKK